VFTDNHVASVVRRFAAQDEDEQPSYYLDDEIRRQGVPPHENTFPLQDLFGSIIHLDGRIHGRPFARRKRVADDLNQPPPPPQASLLRHCPRLFSGDQMIATATASVPFGAPIQNPTNPYGCRLQTTWREIDLALSRVDPFDFNLDVEAMYWGVHRPSAVVFDRFPQTSLFLGHGEMRPEPCIEATSALPPFTASGLQQVFADNYAHNLDRNGRREDAPPPHAAYRDQEWTLDAARLVREPNNVNRYAPMPAFSRPHFVWRDEEVMAQGGNSQLGSDVRNATRFYEPYIISPFLQGQGRYVTTNGGIVQFNPGMWSNGQNYRLGAVALRDTLTGGLLGAVALPLLADVWVEPADGPGRGVPHGANGWQIALAVQSSSLPAFRAYSSGGVVGTRAVVVDRNSRGWKVAEGGVSSLGPTPFGDNALYWAMVDFVGSKTVVTAGFTELLDPHRMPAPTPDPRLGPYFNGVFPAGKKVVYAAAFDPPLDRLPPGTRVQAEYRGAGAVDPQPWRVQQDSYSRRPDAKNFPLDPLKAGDAHIRKDDTRPQGGQPRNYWTYLYNKNLTSYVADANLLSDPAFIVRFAGPNDTFGPDDVRYVNWRLIMHNSSGAQPVSPSLDSFLLTYRFESR
jgi:hypothetical protein